MGARKRIAVVVPRYGLVGGGERFAAALTARLAENPAYDIHVFASQWQAEQDGISFHRVPQLSFPKWLTTPGFAWLAGRRIRAMGFDLVHAHDRLFRADLCTMHFIPHALWIREVRGKRLPSLFDYATIGVERQLLGVAGNCRCLLPVSSLAAAKFRQAYPEATCPVEVVHPGVDDCFFDTPPGEGARLRAELGLDRSALVVLFVAMNFELKGLDRLLAVLGRLRRQPLARKPQLLVVGKGDQRHYRGMAKRCGVEGQLRFLGVRQDLPALYRAADLLALPSGFDTFGMVVSEAMAAGLPVLISPQVGACDLVREGENGFVVARDDSGRAASLIAGLAANEEQRLAMGRAARRAVAGQRWSRVAERVRAVYDRLLHDREPQGG